MKKFPKLSRKILRQIIKFDKKQHKVDMIDFDKHVKFIGEYCFKNGLKSLSFKRKSNCGAWNGDCSFYNPLEFMTPAQRRNVEKQIEAL